MLLHVGSETIDTKAEIVEQKADVANNAIASKIADQAHKHQANNPEETSSAKAPVEAPPQAEKKEVVNEEREEKAQIKIADDL